MTTIDNGPMGLEFFAGFNEVTVTEVEVMVQLGVERVWIGLDDEDDDKMGVDRSDYLDRWQLRTQLREGRLEASIERLLSAGIKVGIHYWLRPVDLWDEAVHRFVTYLANEYPLDAVMADAEKFFLRLDPDEPLEEWLDGWAERWRRPAEITQFDWPKMAVAVYASPRSSSRFVELVNQPIVKTVCPMAYAPNWQTQEPVAFVERSVRQWRQHLRRDQTLLMGLGAYKMARRGVGDGVWMRRVGQAVHRMGVKRVAYWNLEFVDRTTASHRQRREAVAYVAGLGRAA